MMFADITVTSLPHFGAVVAMCSLVFAAMVIIAAFSRRNTGMLIVTASVLFAFFIAGAAVFVHSPGRSAAIWARTRSLGREVAVNIDRGALRKRKAEMQRLREETRERLAESARKLHEAQVETRQTIRGLVESVVPPPAPQPPPHSPGTPPAERIHQIVRVHADEEPSEWEAWGESGLLWNVLSGILIAAFLGVGYMVLDAGTRGHFTWTLRIASAVAFVALWVVTSALRHSF